MTRRTLHLLAATILLLPVAATAVSGCDGATPAPHCPMAAALTAATPPCHGTAIQADDCCPEMTAGEPAAAPPVVVATALEAGAATLAAALPPSGDLAAPSRSPGAATPLYRLFRALLI